MADPDVHTRRRRASAALLVTGALAALTLIAASCGPSPVRAGSAARPTAPHDTKAPLEYLTWPPEDDEPPIAPLIEIPDVLPPGTQLLAMSESDGDYRDYAISVGVARFLPDTAASRELYGRSVGEVSKDGRALQRRWDENALLCTTFEGDDCREVPDTHRAQAMSFSPDGSKFALVAYSEGLGVHEVRVFDSGSLDVIVTAPIGGRIGPFGPVWNPDSSSIAVVTRDERGIGGDLAELLTAPGAEPDVVVPASDEAMAFELLGWSFNGRVAFIWRDGDDHSVRSVSIDGDPDLRVLGAGDAGGLGGVALPDGSVITNGSGDDRGLPHLYGPEADQVRPLSRFAPGEPGSSPFDGLYVFGLVDPLERRR